MKRSFIDVKSRDLSKKDQFCLFWVDFTNTIIKNEWIIYYNSLNLLQTSFGNEIFDSYWTSEVYRCYLIHSFSLASFELILTEIRLSTIFFTIFLFHLFCYKLPSATRYLAHIEPVKCIDGISFTHSFWEALNWYWRRSDYPLYFLLFFYFT